MRVQPTEKVTELMDQIRKLSNEDQRKLNGMLFSHLQYAKRLETMVSSHNFKANDIVKFNAKARGMIFMKLDGVTPAGRLRGTQLNRGIKSTAGTSWTAGADECSHCSLLELSRLNKEPS